MSGPVYKTQEELETTVKWLYGHRWYPKKLKRAQKED